MTWLDPQTQGIPLPRPQGLSAHYWEGTQIGELRFQRCAQCATALFGPGATCRQCRGRDLNWEASAGLGMLYSWTVVWRPPTAGFAAPYAPCIVRLAEGYDMVSALCGLELEAIAPHMSLRVEFHRASAEITLPFFAPLAG